MWNLFTSLSILFFCKKTPENQAYKATENHNQKPKKSDLNIKHQKITPKKQTQNPKFKNAILFQKA